jgi:hypothetical protein
LRASWPLIFAGAALLSGCRGSIEIPPQAQPAAAAPIILQPGQAIQEPNGEEIEAAPARPMCQARARFFRGTVSIPCDEIARTVAP